MNSLNLDLESETKGVRNVMRGRFSAADFEDGGGRMAKTVGAEGSFWLTVRKENWNFSLTTTRNQILPE